MANIKFKIFYQISIVSEKNKKNDQRERVMNFMNKFAANGELNSLMSQKNALMQNMCKREMYNQERDENTINPLLKEEKKTLKDTFYREMF